MTAKQPLVLLPGLLCDAALWQYQVSALAEVADPMVAELTRADSVAGMAADVLASAPGEFALAGLSMGGYVAFEILRQAPGRVTRAAFLDTSARPDDEPTRERRKALLRLARTGRFKGVTPRLLPMLLHPRHQKGPLAAVVMEMAARVGRAAFLRQQTAIMTRPDSRPGLGAIAVPTLVLCGEADELTPVDRAEEIAAGVKGAELIVIPEAGHLSSLEQPAAVNRALIDWLVYS